MVTQYVVCLLFSTVAVASILVMFKSTLSSFLAGQWQLVLGYSGIKGPWGSMWAWVVPVHRLQAVLSGSLRRLAGEVVSHGQHCKILWQKNESPMNYLFCTLSLHYAVPRGIAAVWMGSCFTGLCLCCFTPLCSPWVSFLPCWIPVWSLRQSTCQVTIYLLLCFLALREMHISCF